jgi:hypothetical protein
MDKDDYRAQPAQAGMPSDAPRPAHAQSLVRTWSRLSGRLVPLIGDNGFGALFGRSLRLVAPAFPWLSLEPSRKTSAALLAGLEADLAAVDGAGAATANEELMSTFTRQLGALIGPGLTARLLADVANGSDSAAAADGRQQKQQEHK